MVKQFARSASASLVNCIFARHSACQPPQLVLYAGKHVFGRESLACSPTLLDCPANVFDPQLARLRVLIATKVRM